MRAKVDVTTTEGFVACALEVPNELEHERDGAVQSSRRLMRLTMELVSHRCHLFKFCLRFFMWHTGSAPRTGRDRRDLSVIGLPGRRFLHVFPRGWHKTAHGRLLMGSTSDVGRQASNRSCVARSIRWRAVLMTKPAVALQAAGLQA
eukprot:scaffold7676_cov258-Pinguiococcus_pyrenoidosus.AAC.3